MVTSVVLGLGRVASRNAEKAGLEALSHVGAILAAGGYEILGLVDPDGGARQSAAKRWAGRPVGRIVADASVLQGAAADIVVVAGPTVARNAQIDAALAFNPRVVLVEKPLAMTLDEGRAIVRRVEASGASLLVNFNRRFDPGHVLVRGSLMGTPRKVVMRYGKGLRNYASHMVDLLLDWFGAVESVQAHGTPPSDDGPLDFRCRMAAGFDAAIVGMEGLEYDQFDVDLFYADRRIELTDGGFTKRRYRPIDGRVYPGYAHLTDAPDLMHAGAVGGFVETYTAIRRHLTEGALLGGCGTRDALSGLAVIDAALRSAATGGLSQIPASHSEPRGQ